MEYVYFISRSVTNSSSYRILAIENEPFQSIKIYPVLPFDHIAAWQNPPAVAYIRKFFRSAIETSRIQLPSTQPMPKFIFIN